MQPSTPFTPSSPSATDEPTLHAGRYFERRAKLSEYFGATAAESWAALTSDAPTSFVRRNVRAGREEMRQRLLSWLPVRPVGLRILDAGCGTGAVAVELARRGAAVVGVDVAEAMIAIARERAPAAVTHRLEFVTGDMLDPAFGAFDYVIAMDSLIHYDARDAAAAVVALASRAARAMCFTVAPRTPALAARHALGRLFPRSSRSPEIAPLATARLTHDVLGALGAGYRAGRSTRVSTGFYVSQAIEIARIDPDLSHWNGGPS